MNVRGLTAGVLMAAAGLAMSACTLNSPLKTSENSMTQEQMQTAVSGGFDSSKIEEIVTPKGLHVWLIHAPELPMIAVELNFRAGAMLEPQEKQGVANFTAALTDEGAGEYDAKAFREELDAIGARFGANTDMQDFGINLTTLSEHKERAFELMGLAVMQPRYDADAVARMRDALLADIRQGDEDPGTVAWRLFRPAVYGAHAYANGGEGTLTSVASLNAEDARAWHDRYFTKANLRIAVVGDISGKDVSRLLDKALGDLPAGTERFAVEVAPSPTTPQLVKKQMDVPQSTVLWGHLGLPRTDPDFYAMLVMNEMLGGNVLTSRLGLDVREKHGLVYGINSVNAPLPHNGMFYISFATGNANVAKALGLVRAHLKTIRDEPVGEEELADAKAYLIGSFPLRLDSNAKLLNMIAMMQSESLPKDYLTDWPKRIAAVTKADVQRVAQRLIVPDAAALVIVGDKEALDAQ